MKRYLLFVGPQYYPGGGWHDFADDFDTLAEADEAAAKRLSEEGWGVWYHIVDTTTKKIKEGENG